MCSLASANGPSVVTLSRPVPPLTTVAASGPWRAPPKTNAPAVSISSSSATTRDMKDCISTGVAGAPSTAPSTSYTDNRYWFIRPPHPRRAGGSRFNLLTNGQAPIRTLEREDLAEKIPGERRIVSVAHRWLSAVLVPSRCAEDLFAGWWQLI